jgi:hypothetical protein
VRDCEAAALKVILTSSKAFMLQAYAFVVRLRKEHGRKSKFWELVHEGA